VVGKPEGNTLLGRPRHRWDDNIKVSLEEIDWEDVEWINLAGDIDKWLGNEPSGCTKCGELLDQLRTLLLGVR
jgi:hypothetical protein